jgi:hypothetical protein
MRALCRAAARAARAALPQAPPSGAPLGVQHAPRARFAGSAALVRDPRFAVLTDADVAFFREQLGDTAVITGAVQRARGGASVSQC